MKRSMLWAMFALAAIALVVAPSAALAQDTFKAKFSGPADLPPRDGKYYPATATGSGTYVGSFSFEADIHFYGWSRIAGPMTFTAADGDELYGTFDQTWDAATTAWVGTYTLSGGTGRFKDATGSGDFDVAIDPNARTATGTLNGTISF